MIGITFFWQRQPLYWLGISPIAWPWALLAGVLGVGLGAAVPLLTMAAHRLLAPSTGGTVESVTSSAPAWVLLSIVLTGSVTEERRFRAYPLEHLTRLTGRCWPRTASSLAACGAFHLQGWNVGYVVGVVLPLGAVLRPLPVAAQSGFMIITHFLLDLPIILVSACCHRCRPWSASHAEHAAYTYSQPAVRTTKRTTTMTLTLSMRRTILRVHVVVLTLFSFALTLCFTPARGAAAVLHHRGLRRHRCVRRIRAAGAAHPRPGARHRPGRPHRAP